MPSPQQWYFELNAAAVVSNGLARLASRVACKLYDLRLVAHTSNYNLRTGMILLQQCLFCSSPRLNVCPLL